MSPIEDPARRQSPAAAPPSAMPIGSPIWKPAARAMSLRRLAREPLGETLPD
jgi:hypothetical protein